MEYGKAQVWNGIEDLKYGMEQFSLFMHLKHKILYQEYRDRKRRP